MASNTGPFIAKHGLRVVNYIAADGTMGATIVGHISATGNIWTSAGQLGEFGGSSLSGDTFKSTTAYHYISSFANTYTSTYTEVYNTSANWNSVWTLVNQNSANWTWVADNSARAGAGFYTVNTLSAVWLSTATAVNSESANWNWARSNVLTGTDIWNSAYTDVNANSANWDAGYTFTAERPHYDSVYATVSANSASWGIGGEFEAERPHYDSVYSTVSGNSANWDAGYAFISERPHYDSVYSTVSGNSANWDAAYNEKINSGSFATGTGVLSLTQQDSTTIDINLNGRYASISATADAESVYTTVALNSADWSYVAANSGGSGEESDPIFTAERPAYDSVYSTVSAGSANWDAGYAFTAERPHYDSVYSTVSANSASWGIGGEFEAERPHYDSVYSTVSGASGDWNWAYNNSLTGTDIWNSTNTDVNANSANWDAGYAFVTERPHYDSVYSTVSAGSANWDAGYAFVTERPHYDSAYSTVSAGSANWDAGYAFTIERPHYDSVYATVSANSASWGTGGEFEAERPHYDSVYSTVSAGSANWDAGYAFTSERPHYDSVYSTVSANSAVWALNTADVTNLANASATWDWAYSNAITGTDVWNSTNTDVNANSGDWMSTFSTVYANSAIWLAAAGGWTDDGTVVRLTDAGEKVGIGTVTPGEKLSVAGAISAQTIVYGDTSNSNQWGSNWTTTNANSGHWDSAYTWLDAHSGQWESTHTDVNAQSADWRNGYLLSLTNHSTLNSNSGRWESNYSTTYNNSGDWENVWSHVHALSSDWNASGAGAWSVNAESEVFRLSNVGIGTSNPSHPLDVVGDVRVTGNLTVEGISKDFKTSDKAITINHASTTNSSGSAGIEIEENSKVRGSIKINANRGGWTLLEPLSTRQLVFALSGHSGGTSTWNVSAGLDVEDPSAINQDVTTDATNVQFGKLGIGIAPSEELTVAGSISAQDLIYTGAGQSTEWQSTYTDFKALSGDIGNEATVRLLSGNWHSTYTDVNANSANWDWAYSNAVSGTANGNWAHANSISGTDLWNWSYANNISGTDLWNWAHANNLSGTDIWNWAHANAVSGTDNWNAAYDFTAERPHYDSVYATVSAGSANWDAGYAFVTERPHYDSVYSTVSAGSAEWTTTHTNVNANSAIWTWGVSNSATIYEDLTVHGSISAQGGLSATGALNYFSGKLGIGTTAPARDLDVQGDIGLNEYIYHNGDNDTYLRFAPNLVNLVAGGKSAIKYEASTGKILINNTNQNVDLQVMNSAGTPVLHTDATLSNVGINTTSPTESLTLSGSLSASGHILLSEDQRIFFESDRQTWIESHGADLLRVVAGGNQMLLLDYDTGNRAVFGNGTKVYIGSNNNHLPAYELEVTGAISARGIIYASGGNSDLWNWGQANSLSGTDLWNWAHANSLSGTDLWNWAYTNAISGTDLWNWTHANALTANAAASTALSGKINSAAFNTDTGVLSLSQHAGGSVTVDLDGRYATDAAGVNADSVHSTVDAHSGNWEKTYTTVKASSADWEWTHANSISGTDLWNWSYANSISGTDLWNWSNSNLISGADGWTSTNTDVNANSALWTSVYSTVQANSGTGTNNYVARWVNAKKIGDSSIYNDGTYTGIGTTAPLAKLVVSGGNVLHPEISATSVFTSSVTALTGVVGSVRGVDSSTVNFHDSISVNSNVQAVTFNGINLDSLSLDVHASSGNWNNTYSTLGTYSGAWVSTNAEVAAHSGHWTNSYNTLTGLSAAWVSTNTDVAANSGKWNNTHSVVNLLSSTWSNSVSGVSAERIGKTFTQTNTFTAGRVIRRDVNGSFQLAKANAPLSADVVGVIQSADSAKFDVVFSGILNFPSHGFTVGKPVYLSQTWDGALTETEPTAAGTVTKPVGIVIDASVIQVMPYRGIYNNAVINSSVYSTVNTNSADWNYVAANSGAGASLRATISQSNSFSAGRVIRVNSSGTYVTSKADNVDSADVVGVVSYANGSSFTVYYGGVMDWTSHGKTVGSNLFLSNGHTGWLTETPVTDANSFNKPVAFVLNANSVLVWPQRGIQNTTSGGGGGGGGGSDVSSLSSDWENTHTTVNANSGYWGQTVTTVRANSGHWTTVVKDQGSTITGNASAFNFVGNGVVATVDTTGTVQVSSFDATGGGGGGSSRTDFEIMMAASVFR